MAAELKASQVCYSHCMASAFIGGPPTAGKSFLAESIASQFGCPHISTDELRKRAYGKNPFLEEWIFYFSRKQKGYWCNVTCKDYMSDIEKQTLNLWPYIKIEIDLLLRNNATILFEGVDFIPEVARMDIGFSGAYLLTSCQRESHNRNVQRPRVGRGAAALVCQSNLFHRCESIAIQRAAVQNNYLASTDHTAIKRKIVQLLNQTRD